MIRLRAGAARQTLIAAMGALGLGLPAAGLCGTAAAQAAPTAPAAAPISDKLAAEAQGLMAAARSSDLAYRLVEDLTTEIGPRLAGSEAEARARDWAVTEFTRLGFKNVRIETFELPYWERRRENARIVAPFPQSLTITALGYSVPTPEGGITAEVVRFASMSDLANAPMNGQLAGKIVFVDEPTVRTQDGSGYGVGVRKRSGAANEGAKRGAIGALIRSVGTHSHRLPHTGVLNYASGVTPIPAAALSPVDADQLARAMTRGPVTVALDIGVETRPAATSGNVIGEIPGRGEGIVVIGAHLDSWDLGTGAVDDGAGVGIVMGAGKAIIDARRKPEHTIRVVLFGAEEVGLVGARAYAAAHADAIGRHVIAAESDFGAGRIYQFRTGIGASRLAMGDAIARVLEPLGIARGDNLSGGGPDLQPLRALGVPTATLSQNGWDYFDLHHTPDDTFDKIDPEDLAQNVAAYAGFTWLAANMPGTFRDTPAATTP